MGHTNLEQTYGYVHLLKDVEQEADELLEDLISETAVANTATENTEVQGLKIQDLIPEDLVINGVSIRDLILTNFTSEITHLK